MLLVRDFAVQLAALVCHLAIAIDAISIQLFLAVVQLAYHNSHGDESDN